MCGIVAIDKLTDLTRNMIPYLALEIERRGIDSWGLTDGQEIYRRLGPISEGLMGVLKSGKIDNWQKLLMHTRAASTGMVDLQNCHPLVGNGNDRTIIGIHNGVISNHNEMNQLLGRNMTCDSMHLFQNLAEDINWEELNGWGVALWTDSKEDHAFINLARLGSHSDICVIQLESGEIIACSWEESIRKTVRWVDGKIKHEFKIKPEMLYQICNGDIVEIRPMVTRRYTFVSHPHRNTLPIIKSDKDTPELCVYCGRNTINSDKALVCQTCFVELLEVDNTWVMPNTRWNSKTLSRLNNNTPNLDVVKRTITNIVEAISNGN